MAIENVSIKTIRYVARIKGLEFEPIQLDSPDPSIEKVTVRTENVSGLNQSSDHVYSNSVLDFALVGVYSEAAAKEKVGRWASDLVNQIAWWDSELVDRTSYMLNCQIDDPQPGHVTYYDASGNLNETHVALMPTGEFKLEPRKLDEQESEGLKLELSRRVSDNKKLCFALYRNALNQTNSIAQFMLLYQLMLWLCRDSDGKERQEYVEQQIKRLEPNVTIPSDPRNQNKMETIYTCLRNEVGHFRQYAVGHPHHNIDASRRDKDIGQRLEGLRQIAKQIILEKT